jgi:SAM-dependent methyltransferase
MSKPLDGYVKRLTGMVAGESSIDVYEDWASGYEDTMLKDYGYVAPRIAAGVFETLYANRDTPILDLGCGTGLVGVELASRSYQQIDGLDIARNMLGEAREKAVYRDLLEGDMTGPLDLGGRRYGAAVGVPYSSRKRLFSRCPWRSQCFSGCMFSFPTSGFALT